MIEISKKQMERAEETLRFIPDYINIGDYNGAVNRAYYAAFHSLKSLEALDNYDSKKHSGLINYFRQNYIKSEIFDETFSDILQQLSQSRNNSDYSIIIEISKTDAQIRYEQAKQFVETIKRYVSALWQKSE